MRMSWNATGKTYLKYDTQINNNNKWWETYVTMGDARMQIETKWNEMERSRVKTRRK